MALNPSEQAYGSLYIQTVIDRIDVNGLLQGEMYGIKGLLQNEDIVPKFCPESYKEDCVTIEMNAAETFRANPSLHPVDYTDPFELLLWITLLKRWEKISCDCRVPDIDWFSLMEGPAKIAS